MASKYPDGPMSEDQLVAQLRSREADAQSYYSSELATAQAYAMERFNAELYGDEVDGRSKIRTHDVEDTINWMMPPLMGMFFGTDNLVTCQPNRPQDQDAVEDAGQYLEHILMVDNEGRKLIHDFAFDGLLQRIGVVSVMWQDPKPKPPEVLEGVSVQQLMEIQADPEYEILEQAEDNETIDAEPAPQPQTASPQPGQGGSPSASPVQAPQQAQLPAPQDPNAPTPLIPITLPTFKLKVRRTPLVGRVVIENVPPEEIAFERRARAFPNAKRGTALSAGYVRRKQEKYLSDVMKDFPEWDGELAVPGVLTGQTSQDMDSDPRVLARFDRESVPVGAELANNENAKKIYVLTEYIAIDFDGDGEVELRRVVRVENTILENVVVDDCEFKNWSPIRVAHKAVGRSIADTVIDMQKIRTVMMRNMLDGQSQSLVPRAYINTQAIDEQGVDDFLDAEIGGTVRGKGPPDQAFGIIQSPDVSASALQSLEYLDQLSEQQSGVTRHAQGIAPDAITKTASGIENLQEAANQRIELVGRWLGIALEEVLSRALQLICAHQDRPRWIKIKGKPLNVDPRTWSDEMGVTVQVGTAASPQAQIMNLMAIAAKQEQAIQVGGPDNPVCDVTQLIYTYSRITELQGFKDPTKFWKTPDEARQKLAQIAAQPPPPDPKMLAVQQDGQHKQAQLQMDGAAKQAELQQKDKTSQAEIALKVAQQQAEAALADRQQQQDAALALRQQEFNERLAVQEQIFNQQLAKQQAEFDQRMAEKKADHDHQVALKKAAQASKVNGGKAPTAGRRIELGGQTG